MLRRTILTVLVAYVVAGKCTIKPQRTLTSSLADATPTTTEGPTVGSNATYDNTKVSGKAKLTRIVAFGDNLSDNGNGSYRLGIIDAKHPYNAM